MSGFDWSGLLRAGLQAGLRPAEFWALTPAELRLWLGREAAEQPMGRGTLDALMAQFPDSKERRSA